MQLCQSASCAEHRFLNLNLITTANVEPMSKHVKNASCLEPNLHSLQINEVTCFHYNPSISQVRDAVHKEIAELASWSFSIAASGVWPTAGFKGEPLSQGTTRYQRQGQQLALGWKILNGYCHPQINQPWLSIWNFTDTLIFTFGATC